MGAEFITYRDFESLKLLDEFAVETDPPKDPGLKELVPVKSYSKEIEYDGKRLSFRLSKILLNILRRVVNLNPNLGEPLMAEVRVDRLVLNT